MGKYNGTNRRRQQRLNYSVGIKYRIKKLGGGLRPGELINISTTGVGLFITERVFPNDLLEIEIELAGAPLPLKTKAKIAWVIDTLDVGKYRVGVEFVEQSEKNKASLERFVKRHLGSNE